MRTLANGRCGCATGVPESNFNERAFSMKVLAPSRTVGIYAKIPEPSEARADIHAGGE
jgi:hypothetical protein